MMKNRRAKNKKMGKFDTFAEYLNNLLGTHFFVKYYANKSVDWEQMTLQETCHGSMKVIGGSNQSLKDIHTRTDDLSLTFMIPEELFEERSTEVDSALNSIDKQLIPIDSEYIQFIYSYQADIGQVVYNGRYFSSVTFNFSLVSFVDLFMSDGQTVKITFSGNQFYQFKGLSSVTYQYVANYDGSVTQAAVQKNYLASFNETLVLSGLVVENDEAREYVEEFIGQDNDYQLKYEDGTGVLMNRKMKLVSYTRIGISGSLLKFELRFVQKG